MSSLPQYEPFYEVEPSHSGAASPAPDFAALLPLARPHIVAIAALGTLTFGRFLSGELLVGLATVAALDWFLVNVVNRAVDLAEDRENDVPGVAFLAAHRARVAQVAVGALALSLLLTHLLAPALTPWRLGYHALGAAYNFPLLGRRLKRVYGVKNVVSAAGFLITAFAYPLAIAGATIDVRAVAALAVFFFLFELSYELVYDLRDTDGDRVAGVPTLPAVHGPVVAGRVIDLLATMSIGVLVGSTVSGRLAWGHAVLGVAPALQMLLVRIWRDQGGPTDADCVRLTWLGAAMLAVHQGWLLLGLPGASAV